MNIAAVGCVEKSKLLKDYNDATREFAEAVSMLSAKMGVTQKRDYDLMECAVVDARLKSEEARVAYERHVAEHGC